MPSAPMLTRCRIDALCRSLRSCDGRLHAVLLLGSGIYAPSLARDLDLLLVSAAPRRLASYEGALYGTLQDMPAPDLLVRHNDDRPGAMRLAIASGKVLWRRPGDVPLLSAAAVTSADFTDARQRLDVAGALLSTGGCRSGDFALRFAQEAFDTLFLAARAAVMAFLASRVRRRLPARLRQNFEPLTEICHVRYGCEGRLPAGVEAIAAEFARWNGRARELILDAESAAGVSPARATTLPAQPAEWRDRDGREVGGLCPGAVPIVPV